MHFVDVRKLFEIRMGGETMSDSIRRTIYENHFEQNWFARWLLNCN